ncbi:retrovirus-related Pol polyprotein from transposon 17.6 [Trichonephila clavipes]|nr:retrovirus-related Pol polyprotein from transposon 17.6 [Trichonephila clavipes]
MQWSSYISIEESNIITMLDLLKGWLRLYPWLKTAKSYIFSRLHRQQYRFKVMSFGLKNASATFQREINKALSCYREFSRAYIDDIAIFSKLGRTSSSSGYYFNETFRVKFHCEPQKCLWKSSNKYLGHIIGSGKHEPDPGMDCSYQQLTMPKTKKSL